MSTADSPEPRRRIAVSGASGKTGWRVVQEAIGRGLAVRALLRPGSTVPEGLNGAEIVRLELSDAPALEAALRRHVGEVVVLGGHITGANVISVHAFKVLRPPPVAPVR
jgi:nucleoside-diphosphate-sugar epimerase